MLLIDHNNRLYLLDNAGSFLSQLRTCIYNNIFRNFNLKYKI